MSNLPSSAFQPDDRPFSYEVRLAELEDENAELRRLLAATAPSEPQMDLPRAHEICAAMYRYHFATTMVLSEASPDWLVDG